MANNANNSSTLLLHAHPVQRGNGKIAGYQAAVLLPVVDAMRVLDPQTLATQEDAMLTAAALCPEAEFRRERFIQLEMSDAERQANLKADRIEAAQRGENVEKKAVKAAK